jgi:iron complex outermembrane receptor protein
MAMIKWTLATGVSAAAIMLVASTAHAQISAADSRSGASAPADNEIIVTAQRRQERLSDVPLSVTAVTSESLERNRVTDLTRVQLLSPGLQWAHQGSDAFPSIRGVRTQLTSAQNDPVIGFYIDGVYQSRTSQGNFPFFDIARVEVQRGPQGTLYGRNTFGGNISVISNDPVNDVLGGINAGFGNFSSKQVDAFVNVPLSDKIQLRAGIYHDDHGAYTKSITNPNIKINDQDQTAARVALRAVPTDNLEIILKGSFWWRDDHGAGAYATRINGTLINLSTGLRSIYGSPVAVNPTVLDGSAKINGVSVGVPVLGSKYENQWDFQPDEHIREKAGTGQINWDLGPVAVHSITGYTSFRADRNADIDQSSVIFPAPGVTAGFAGSGVQRADTRVQTTSQELQLASTGTTRLSWIVGAYYLNDRITENYSQYYTAPSATALSTLSRTKIETDSYAAYGQATYAIIPDHLRLIGGIRYSHEKKAFDITNFTSPVGTQTFPTQTAAVASGAPKFNKVTWRGGLEYNVDRSTMFYGTVTTGFESGGINNNSSNAAIPSSYAPQTVTAYEVGSKSRFLNGRLAIDASIFYNRLRSLQITVLDQRTNLSYTASAGAARSYGAELDVRTIPVRNLHFDMTAAYNNAKFTDYVRPNPFYTATNGDPVQLQLAGNSVAVSPKIKTTVNTYYDMYMPGVGTFTPSLTWLHSTKYYTSDYNTVLDEQKTYDTLDLALRYSPNKRFYVEAYVQNLTNVAVIYSGQLGSNQRVQVSYGAPRTYGARAGFKF